MRNDLSVPIVILGGGLCGLSAGYHLEKSGFNDYIIIEKNHMAGGLARTETYDGFSFDYSIHILYSQDAYATDLICNELLLGNIVKQIRMSFCYSNGVFTEYPYQANNYGLPANIIVENILGLIEARHAKSKLPAHFEDWIYGTFGRGIAKNFMIPFNRRVWAWDLKDMSYDWISERVPMPEIKEVLEGALKQPKKKYGPNMEFWYPAAGGIEALPNAILNNIYSDQILPNTNVVAVDASRKEVKLLDGRSICYEWLINTIPLPLFMHLLEEKVPVKLQNCTAELKHNIVYAVNIGLSGIELATPKGMHWAYFPEEDLIFHRISLPHHFSEWMSPPGCCSIQAEISGSVYRPRKQSTLIGETLRGLVRVGIISEKEARPLSEGGRVLLTKVMKLNPAYIIYDLKHRENTEQIKAYLKSLKILTKGRFGEWEYLNMDHSILSGKNAVKELFL
jgi:protoporphyrinogen oxidase